jgi:hypothetical protein
MSGRLSLCHSHVADVGTRFIPSHYYIQHWCIADTILSLQCRHESDHIFMDLDLFEVGFAAAKAVSNQSLEHLNRPYFGHLCGRDDASANEFNSPRGQDCLCLIIMREFLEAKRCDLYLHHGFAQTRRRHWCSHRWCFK